MCKASPGLRCSDESITRIKKYGAQIEVIKDDINDTKQRLFDIQSENENFKELPEFEALEKRLEKSEEKLSLKQDKLKSESLEYALTPKGMEDLENLAKDETASAISRATALASLTAASERKAKQQEMLDVKNNENLSKEEKFAYFELEAQYQNRELESLISERNARKKHGEYLKEQLKLAQLAGDTERAEAIKKTLSENVISRILLNKQIDQKRATVLVALEQADAHRNEEIDKKLKQIAMVEFTMRILDKVLMGSRSAAIMRTGYYHLNRYSRKKTAHTLKKQDTATPLKRQHEAELKEENFELQRLERELNIKRKPVPAA